MPDGKTVNLTATAGEVLERGHGQAEHAGPYGAGRLDQGRQYGSDLRQVRHLADCAGRHGRQEYYRRLRPQHDLRLRYVRTEAENPRERWIDPAKPLMLQARESEDVGERLLPRVAWTAASRSNW